MFFEFLVGKTPRKAGCTKNFNRMDMKKVNEKLADKNIPSVMVSFLEECLREKETVEVTLEDGRKVEDPTKSRLSWEEVYLHSLFAG
jgi:hypothetical protein